MLLKSIADLMDFPEEEREALLAEFSHKYNRTYVIVTEVNKNPVIVQILAIRENYITFSHKAITYEQIEKIVPYNPPSGLYKTKDGTVLYLYRLNARQYTKSFRLGVTYSFYIIEKYKEITENEIIDADYLGNHFVGENNCYFYWAIVGKVNNNIITLSNKYKQLLPELSELWSQYKITLDSTHRQQDLNLNKQKKAEFLNIPTIQPIPIKRPRPAPKLNITLDDITF